MDTIKQGRRGTAKVILALAWPTMLEQLMQTAVQYIDTAMVGAIGTHATAAVGATTTINWLIMTSVMALSIGFLSFIARADGAGDTVQAKRACGQAVLTVLAVGIFLTIVTLSLSEKIPKWMNADPAIQTLSSQYFFVLYLAILPRTASVIFGTVLRAAGDTKTPMKVGISVNLINVLLNFLMIYETRQISLFGMALIVPGLGMGVVGAALASSISFFVGGIYMTMAVLKHPRISPRGVTLKPDKTILVPCMRVAIPNMLQRFATSFGYVAFASMINSLGEVATAAHTIANTVESAFYIPGYGMQTAAATLEGNAYGAGDKKKMRELATMFIPIETVLMILSGGLLFVTAPVLMGLFTDSPEVSTLGVTVLRMVAISEPFYGVSIIIEGFMQGVGKTKEPFIYNIVGMWAVRIVGAYLCTQLWGMGLVSAWACMILHNMLLFLLFLISYIRGTWNPLNQS